MSDNSSRAFCSICEWVGKELAEEVGGGHQLLPQPAFTCPLASFSGALVRTPNKVPLCKFAENRDRDQ